MIHAAIFETTDPACRTSLVISGSLKSIALNTPEGGCWRPVPPGCASVADVPPLGELPVLSLSRGAHERIVPSDQRET